MSLNRGIKGLNLKHLVQSVVCLHIKTVKYLFTFHLGAEYT